MKKSSDKRLLLKLGGTCNLHCKHCHCVPSAYELNRDIFPYMNKQGYWKITFGGGEPLLYTDAIKDVVNRMPSDTEYKIVTNGTLLTPELADYFNRHNFTVFFSYDGENDSRDTRYIQAWHELAKIERHGFATLFSADTMNSQKLFKEVQEVRRKFQLNGRDNSVWANFVHQTAYNNETVDRELAKEYCRFLCGQLETDFRMFRKDPKRKDVFVMSSAFNHWIKKYTGRGVKCFNENFHVMTLSGKFLLCPYEAETVGDIYTGIDWDKIEAHLPERCKGCGQWESCGNVCIANVTDNECFISKVMYHHFHKLMDKYGLTYEQLEEAFT